MTIFNHHARKKKKTVLQKDVSFVDTAITLNHRYSLGNVYLQNAKIWEPSTIQYYLLPIILERKKIWKKKFLFKNL